MTSPVRITSTLVPLHAVTGSIDDYDDLVELIGSRRIVLIGEASHGTHEFYRERARITRRLIDELGFTAVAVEADWPDAYRVNRYVMGLSNDTDADRALGDFERFPSWMWRNRDVVDFVEWLRVRNAAHRHPATKARFYGLDLYSLRSSMEAVVHYLEQVDPAEAARARERYSCFDHVAGEGQAYGYSLAFEGAIPCENEVVAQLVELRRRAELVPAPRRLARRGRALLRGAERARRARRRGVLPADVPGLGQLLEPARPAHGVHARRADRPPRPSVRRRQGRGLGAQLARR